MQHGAGTGMVAGQVGRPIACAGGDIIYLSVFGDARSGTPRTPTEEGSQGEGTHADTGAAATRRCTIEIAR